MRAAVALAAARAVGFVQLDPAQAERLDVACQQLGRRCLPLGGHEVTTGWAEGYTPNPDDDGLVLYELAQTRLIALAVCLGLCHQPGVNRYSTSAISVEAFERAVARLRSRTPATGFDGARAAHAHIKGALVDLNEMGYVRFDGMTIQLGPVLAQWSDSEWAQLSTLHERMAGVVE